MVLWTSDDYGKLANIANWTMFGMAAVVIGLRIISRQHYSQKLGGGLGIDDWITLFCLAVFLVTNISGSISYSYGLGRRYNTLSPDSRQMAMKWGIINDAVVIWQFSLPKFAIIATLKRIPNYGVRTTIVFWGLALSSQACILATSVWWVRQCSPVEYGWNKNIEGQCASINILKDLGYFTSAYSIFLDVFFAAYPAPFIMRLNMPLKNRIAVTGALGLSSLAAVVGIYKLSLFKDVFAVMIQDETLPVPCLLIPAEAEGAVNMICASLPALGPLIRRLKAKSADVHRNSTGLQAETLQGEHPEHLSHSEQAVSPVLVWKRLDNSSTVSQERSSGDEIPLIDLLGSGGNISGGARTVKSSLSKQGNVVDSAV